MTGPDKDTGFSTNPIALAAARRNAERRGTMGDEWIASQIAKAQDHASKDTSQ